MKINFSEANVVDFEGNPLNINSPAHKILADGLGKSGIQLPDMGFMDMKEFCLSVNRGDVVDLEVKQQEFLSDFIENQLAVINFVKYALFDCMSKPDNKKNGKENKQTDTANAETSM